MQEPNDNSFEAKLAKSRALAEEAKRVFEFSEESKKSDKLNDGLLALEFLYKAAMLGHRTATNQLFTRSLSHEFIQNDSLCKALLTEVKKKSPDTLFLCALYKLSQHSEGATDKAYKLLERAANANDARAQSMLAHLHLIAPKHFFALFTADFSANIRRENAFPWAQRAAAQNDPHGLYLLGSFYYSGSKKYPKDEQKAEECFRQSAAQHYPPAMNGLAKLLLKRKAYPEALQWLELAAAQNYDKAQFSLAKQFLNGVSTPQDFKKAAEGFRASAKLGSGAQNKARALLGKMYSKNQVPYSNIPEDIAQYRHDYAVLGCRSALQYLEKLIRENKNSFAARYYLCTALNDLTTFEALCNEDTAQFYRLLKNDDSISAFYIRRKMKDIFKHDAFSRLPIDDQIELAEFISVHDAQKPELQTKVVQTLNAVPREHPRYAQVQAFLLNIHLTDDKEGYLWQYHQQLFCEAEPNTDRPGLNPFEVAFCQASIAGPQALFSWLKKTLKDPNAKDNLTPENFHEFQYQLANAYYSNITGFSDAKKLVLIDRLKQIPETHPRFKKAGVLLLLLEKHSPKFWSISVPQESEAQASVPKTTTGLLIQ